MHTYGSEWVVCPFKLEVRLAGINLWRSFAVNFGVHSAFECCQAKLCPRDVTFLDSLNRVT